MMDMTGVNWQSFLSDCTPNEQLDQLTRDAALLFHTPIAMINLMTNHEVIFKACVGQVQGGRLKHKEAFCSVAVLQAEPLHIADTLADPIYQDYGLVTGPLGIRSYLGKSLHTPDGAIVGTLCLMDTKTRNYTQKQLDALCCLAEQVEVQLASLLHSTKPVLAAL